MKRPSKKPCAECPFLRTALRGYLGAQSPEDFIRTTLAEYEMPCHTAVDYDDEEWRDKLDTVPQCAGSAIFFANQCKLPRNSALFELPADCDAVFRNTAEFLSHHMRRELTDEEIRGIIWPGNAAALRFARAV